MTDRANALVVVLSHDVRVDDVQPLVDAIQQFKGVLSVTPNVADLDSHLARTRAFYDIRERLLAALAREGESS